MPKTLLVGAACALTVFSCLSANASSHYLDNVDVYALDLRAPVSRSRNPARISADLTQGRAAQLDPLMGKSTFVWAGANEPVGAVGPLTATALIEVRGREFLRRQAPVMGIDLASIDEAVAFDVQDLGHGPVIARYEQYLGGVPVFNRSLNVMLNREGRPVAASGYFATDFSRAEVLARSFDLSPAQAVSAALVNLGGSTADYAFAFSQTLDDYQVFSATPLLAGALQLDVAPRVKRVYFPRKGTLEPAFYVELQGARSASRERFAQGFVVSAVDGSVLFRKDQIAYEAFTYRVWADAASKQPHDAPLGNGYTPFPAATKGDPITRTGVPMELITLDHAGISTGDSWLPPGATETISNHVDACLDIFDTPVSGVISNPTNTCNPELGDERGQVSSANTFDYSIEADSDPAAGNAPQAAVVNLFYINNWLHDWWYDHGFNELARNAQTDNYGRGGAGNDAVKAQGQDASGRNNANMATPADGSSPTMQQYLFDGYIKGVVKETIPEGPDLLFTGAAFGPQSFDVTNVVELVAEDPLTGGASLTDGCGTPDPLGTGLVTAPAAPQVSLAGRIALLDRGNCNFTTKAQFALASGAVGLVIVNNTDADPITMGNGDVPLGIPAPTSPTDPAYQIPTVMIRKADGATIRAHVAAGGSTMRLNRIASIDQDGTLDNQIIAHEYFHYVSNRLVSNSSGLGNQQGGGLGEGWGDISALMLSARPDDTLAINNDRWQGPYSLAWYVINNFWSGIRRVPYSTDPATNAFTFKHISDGEATPDGGAGASNSQVHNTGEVWANMVWNCYASILNVPGNTFAESQFRMKDYLIGGMKMTPASPTFTEARDGILAAAMATDYEDFAACARGFARKGAGVYAVSPPRDAVDNVGVTESYIALVGKYTLARMSFVASENDRCDLDAVLDSGESGTLEMTFRNDGSFVTPDVLGATVSTTSSDVGFGNGGRITLPRLLLGQSATVTVPVDAGALTGSPAAVPIMVDFDAFTPADPEVEDAADENVTLFANQDGGLREFDDIESTVTSPADWTRTGSGADWTQVDAAATQGNGKAWHGEDPATVADIQLVTPSFSVPDGGTFTLEFTHFFDFDSDLTGDYDGGVIEVQVDGGAWTDVIAHGATFGAGGYNSAGISALGGRAGYGATNTAKEDVVLDFGQTLAGHDARLRFRLASDSSVAGGGWFIDDVTLNGIATGVFSYFADEDGICLVPITISAGPDLSVQELEPVALHAAVTDPNAPPLALTFAWEQLSGPAVTLAGGSTLDPTFTAPSVASSTALVFRVVARSGGLDLASDEVRVTVENIAAAPGDPVGVGAGGNKVGGSFGPVGLLLLAGLAALRRRRRR